MSGFDPTFDAAGTGTRDGAVPAPGSIDGRTYFLRADKTWAAPGSSAPGPEPPAPGPDLDQWACNIAGYLTYEVSRLAVKYVVDWLPVSWIGDVAGGIVAGIAGVLLPASLLVDGVVEAAIFHWVSSLVSTHLVDVGAALLDDAAWAKIHCALYDKIKLTPTDLHAAILAFTGILGGLVGWTTPAVAAIVYLFENIGIVDVGNIPITAFVRSYDCTTCATTGIGPAKPVLQTSFDLTITDGTNKEPFTDTVDFVGATVAGAGATATVTPNNATSSTVGVSRPDNTTIGVTAGVLSTLATPSTTTLYSTVGTGKKFLLGSEPAGWQNVGFDDSAWTAPVLETGGGPTPEISGAARITSNDGNVSTSAVFLFRLAFTLAPGDVLAAVSTILEDNTSTVWINGTEISTYTRPPGDSSGPHATSFDTTLLSTSNVLAIKIENGSFGFGSNPMSVEYKIAITQAANGELTVEQGGSVVGSRRAVNLTDGGGITWTVMDDPSASRVDISAATAFTNPMTTAADLIVGGTAGAASRLAKGSDGQVLTVDPITHLLVWATPAAPGSGTLTAVTGSAPIVSSGGTTPAISLTTPLAPVYGGTGHDLSAATDGQIPIASTSDHKFTAANITAGSGIAITNTAGGIQVAASGTGGGGTALTQLAIVVVAVAVSTVSITGISGAFSHLKVIWLARSTTASTAWDDMNLRFNNDSSAIYDWNVYTVNGSSDSGSQTFGDTKHRIGEMLQDSLGAGFWSMGEILIPWYASAVVNKSYIATSTGDRNAGANTMRDMRFTGTWRSVAAVTRLDFLVGANNFKVGTSFSLYGIA